jgi:hypothetical protein
MATYRIGGAAPGLTAARVTSVLEVSPTASGERGERRTPRSPVAQVSWWSLASGAEPDATELSTQLDRVLAKLIARRDALWRLADEGYEMDWFCYVGSYASEHAVELSRQMMERLLAVPGELLLDVYGEDSDEG